MGCGWLLSCHGCHTMIYHKFYSNACREVLKVTRVQVGREYQFQRTFPSWTLLLLGQGSGLHLHSILMDIASDRAPTRRRRQTATTSNITPISAFVSPAFAPVSRDLAEPTTTWFVVQPPSCLLPQRMFHTRTMKKAFHHLKTDRDTRSGI